MDFQEFLEYVPKIMEAPLPAKEAHYKMAPLERIEKMEKLELQSKNPKIAAVMMLFYPKNGSTHIVLIVRNSYEGVHSAQIAFPGGKFEPEDETFEITALRETFEEIGIHPDRIEILRQFTHLYIPPSNFLVYPYLGICKEEILFVPDSSEVAAIIELPLSLFLGEEVMVSVAISTSYANDIMVPAFKIGEHIVWGATAMMLSELKEVLKKVL
jgi:8-oxo-dGTP pyrophosphatase MutT (NUDIX family)